MKRLLLKYTLLEWKRMLRCLPKLLAGSLFFIAMTIGILFIIQLNPSQNKKQNTINIGVVCDQNEPFVDWMIRTIQQRKTTEQSCRFQLMSQKEATKKLQNEQIDLIFVIPHHYIQSIIDGTNKHVTIRFSKGDTTIVSFLFRQLCVAASSFILNTEAGIYTMNDYYRQYSIPERKNNEMKLNLRYVREIAKLNALVKTEEIADNSQKTAPFSNYIASAIVLLLLLWGLCCSKILSSQNRAFQEQLIQNGVSVPWQLLARSVAFYLTILCNWAILCFLGSIALVICQQLKNSLSFFSIFQIWNYYFLLFPVMLFACFFIQLAYEITEETMSGILFLFYSTILMGLFSGCFYPMTYLPFAIQQIGKLLPTYFASQYTSSILTGNFSLSSLLILFAECFVILLLIFLIRLHPGSHLSFILFHKKRKTQRFASNRYHCYSFPFTYFILWTKRILKHPLTWFTILLLPASALFLHNCHSSNDAVLRVALYQESASSNQSDNSLLTELSKLSNTSISFYECKSIKELQEDVASKKASCGYIFPNQLEQKLKLYAQNHEPFITSIHNEGIFSTKLIDEIVLSKLFQPLSYYILEDFLAKNTTQQLDSSYIEQNFSKYKSSELLFQFEYANGKENNMLNNQNANYMMLPIRGLVAVFILLASMTGAIFWYEDNQKQLYVQMKYSAKCFCLFYSLFIPTLISSIVGIITLKIAGISPNVTSEIPAMFCYIFACIAFTNFLRSLPLKKDYFLATIPFIMILSLVFCPIFIDISNSFSVFNHISMLLPTKYYLKSIHDSTSLFSVVLYISLTLILTFLSKSIQRIVHIFLN